MAYRIAGIDVHKRMLAVVIADVTVDGEYEFQRRQVGTSPSELRMLAEWLATEEAEEAVMESTAQYWRPVWATLEQLWDAETPGTGGCRTDVGQAASGAGAIESRAIRAEERFSGCGTTGEAISGPGTHAEFCARRRATVVANSDAAQVPVDPQSGPVPEPSGVFAGRSSYQAVELGFGSPRPECAPHVASACGWGNQPRCRGGTARQTVARYAGSNCPMRSARVPICIPSTAGS